MPKVFVTWRTIFTCPNCNFTAEEPMVATCRVCEHCGEVMQHDASEPIYGTGAPAELVERSRELSARFDEIQAAQATINAAYGQANVDLEQLKADIAAWEQR